MNKYIIIGSIIIVIILITTIIVYLITRDDTPNPSVPRNDTPPVSITPATSPVVDYLDRDQEKSIDYIKNRKNVTESDALARAQLLSRTGGKTGIIHTTPTYQIEYLLAPNAFMVAVQTTEISTVKQEVQSWLLNQGLSNDGICKLPISFYLTPSVAKQMNRGNTFSPLALGC